MTTKRFQTMAEFEAERAKKLKVMPTGQTRWACACGSTRFILLGDANNTKAKCARCGNLEIIAWYPDARDSSKGAVRDLRDNSWHHLTYPRY